MRFDLFENMNAEEAEDILREFREHGGGYLKDVVPNGELDFSLCGFPNLMESISNRLTTILKDDDVSVPEFIRNTEDYRSGLFEFAPDARRLIIGCAFYLGECFIRKYPGLRWAIGNPQYATGMMPVVAGFNSEKELPALLVMENLFSRRITNPTMTSVFENAIQRWEKNAS